MKLKPFLLTIFFMFLTAGVFVAPFYQIHAEGNKGPDKNQDNNVVVPPEVDHNNAGTLNNSPAIVNSPAPSAQPVALPNTAPRTDPPKPNQGPVQPATPVPASIANPKPTLAPVFPINPIPAAAAPAVENKSSGHDDNNPKNSRETQVSISQVKPKTESNNDGPKDQTAPGAKKLMLDSPAVSNQVLKFPQEAANLVVTDLYNQQGLTPRANKMAGIFSLVSTTLGILFIKFNSLLTLIKNHNA